MALIEPIPGQEERNADHLLEAGAAIRCNNLPAAAWKIAGLLDDPARLTRMRDAARSLGRPDAAATIAEDALRLVN
jgi:processive 1,2-diacylglycerol beta-glucosyltransferase